MANHVSIMLETSNKKINDAFKDALHRHSSNPSQPTYLRMYDVEINKEGLNMFEIFDNDGFFVYYTQWRPNIKDVVTLATMIGEDIEFTLTSEEFGLDDNHYVNYYDGKIQSHHIISIYDYCEPCEDGDGVIENETGDWWDSESDFLAHIIKQKFN